MNIDGKSLDIVQDNLAKLKQHFPNLVKEGEIDLHELKATFGQEPTRREERYGLSWAGKYDAFKQVQEQTTHTLIPDRDNSFEFDRTENIFIEGENLDVLKILQKSYYGQIKMIYIDPPYNTGNDHFIYPDKYAESKEDYLRRSGAKDERGYLNKADLFRENSRENGQFHSVWLGMMYPRLYLARNLLREDGVIFISIDDNEVANLRLLMDEVFGEENFVGLFIVNSSPSAIDYGHIAKMHDYALFYAKNLNEATTYQLPDKDKEFRFVDEFGPFNLYPLYHGNVAFNPDNRPNLYYPFYLNPGNKITENFYEIGLEEREGWVKVYPVISKKDRIPRVWRWSRAKSREQLNKEIVGYETESGEFRIVQKTRHTGKVIRSMQIDKEISTRRGTRQVEELFGSKVFPFPKSIELIKRFLSVGTQNDDIILDFFAGSCTTAHAILDLNKEDGGNRKFICIQLPEETPKDSPARKASYDTISDIGRTRIRKVIEKMNTERAVQLPLEPRTTLGFRSFTLASSNFKIWRGDMKLENEILTQLELFQRPAQNGNEEAMLWELVLKAGYLLSAKIEAREVEDVTIYFINDSELIIALQAINQAVVETVRRAKPRAFICLDSLFNDDDPLKTNTSLLFKDEGITFRVI